MTKESETLLNAKLVATHSGTKFVGIGENYRGNAARINSLAQLDDQLGVESVCAEGDNIVVSIQPDLSWTRERIEGVAKLFA